MESVSPAMWRWSNKTDSAWIFWFRNAFAIATSAIVAFRQLRRDRTFATRKKKKHKCRCRSDSWETYKVQFTFIDGQGCNVQFDTDPIRDFGCPYGGNSHTHFRSSGRQTQQCRACRPCHRSDIFPFPCNNQTLRISCCFKIRDVSRDKKAFGFATYIKFWEATWLLRLENTDKNWIALVMYNDMAHWHAAESVVILYCRLQLVDWSLVERNATLPDRPMPRPIRFHSLVQYRNRPLDKKKKTYVKITASTYLDCRKTCPVEQLTVELEFLVRQLSLWYPFPFPVPFPCIGRQCRQDLHVRLHVLLVPKRSLLSKGIARQISEMQRIPGKSLKKCKITIFASMIGVCIPILSIPKCNQNVHQSIQSHGLALSVGNDHWFVSKAKTRLLLSHWWTNEDFRKVDCQHCASRVQSQAMCVPLRLLLLRSLPSWWPCFFLFLWKLFRVHGEFPWARFTLTFKKINH